MKRNIVSSTILAEWLRMGLGGVQLIVLSLVLGTEGFGVYSAVFAAAAILQPVVYAGAVYWIQPYLLDRSKLRPTVSHLLLWSALASVVVSPVFAGFLAMRGTGAFLTIYILLVGETGVSLLVHQLCLVYLGMRKMGAYMAATTSLAVARVLAACMPLVFSQAPALMVVGLAQTGLGSLLCIVMLHNLAWRPGLWFTAFRENRKRLFGFGAVGFLQVVLDNVDKLILMYLLPLSTLGVVGMASRIDTYSLVPARGYALAVYPRYFEAAETDRQSVLRIAQKAGSRGAAMTVGLSLIAVLSAIILEGTILSSYSGLGVIAALLVLRLCVRPFSYAYGDALYALGRATNRLVALSLTTLGYMVALLLLVPAGGIVALACAGLVAEILNAVMLWNGVRKAA